MSYKHVGDLLDRIGCLNHACDLDLLLVFHRHPRVVLSSERLAIYIGHELPRVAQSLDTLIGAGLLSRTQRAGGVERMYVLVSWGAPGGWLDALLRLASTREGRLAVLAALARPRPEGESPKTSGLGPAAARCQLPRARAASESEEFRHA
jgi:hypothetical protein